MASLFDELDINLCLACDTPKIAYICTDCTGLRLHLCKDCYKGHITAGHQVVDINKYQKNPSKYQLAEERKCKKHPGKQLELVCAPCNVLLCLMCPHDSSVTCQKTPGGKGKHETGPLNTAVKLDKKTIDESLSTAAHHKANVKATIRRCKRMKSDARSQHNRVKVQAEKHERKLISAIKAKTKSIIDKSARLLQMSDAQADRSIGDMEDFLENLRRTRKEAKGLKSSSAGVRVHRLTPSVVDRLITPFPTISWNIPTLNLDRSRRLNETDEMEELVGTLVSYNIKKVHVESRLPPSDCCIISTTKGPALLEAYGISGLFLAVSGEAAKKISADGGHHSAVCTSPDGKIIYSTTSKNTICMYTVEDDSLNLVREVTVEGAKHLFSIRASPTTGNLAVMDDVALRITLHDKALLFLRSIQNLLKGRYPCRLEWSPCGDHLFITDWGKGGMERSVVKLKVEPVEITWRKSLDNNPDIVRHIGGRLYITHWHAHKVTVISAGNGSIIKIIPTHGKVVEMRESPHADVEMLCYTHRFQQLRLRGV